MQAKVKQEFEQVSCKEHPFIMELYRKARNSAKKYDNTLRAQQKAKDGSKLNSDQKEKVRNLEDYKRSVNDAIETLALFAKHHCEDGQAAREVDDDAYDGSEGKQDQEDYDSCQDDDPNPIDYAMPKQGANLD